ncbi:SpoIIE family protein phosphatase [Nocardiopsis aegyptia]|uniref:Serine phosphatase RsbU (Regulator of sigma subunit)/anti-sigma regulatory factor (Ser/Thr protein kinase) n=1 Tax=Nocardiopsis aegyptia TaxID=220378 RepID=A0A7Z0EI70_9ACTN|nr:SpoIIE family protein phosphatase [Nocardiopsis aegyptia]NYJ32456.1 serine phosphatase RsbU (regulator of sigma subunit)/anti-sigma regulatory factor (Ser/Thr protein kinase) [Nocardiopsis aegyptia]
MDSEDVPAVVPAGTVPEQADAVPDRAGDAAPLTAVLKQWALDQIPLPMALFDHRARAIAVNAAMERAMGRPERDLLGLRLGESGPDLLVQGLGPVDEVVERVLRDGASVPYEAYLRVPGESREHAWLLNLYPVKDADGRIRAMSVAGVDTTEQYRARRRLGVLNEVGLRIGTTLDVGRTADELAQVSTEHFADFAIVDLLDAAVRGEEADPAPPGGETVFRRSAQRSVLEGCPESVIPLGELHTYTAHSPPGRALGTGRAARYTVDDAHVRWWAADAPERAHSMTRYGVHSKLLVPLTARGVTLGLLILARHRTPEPFGEDDQFLAEELASRAALCVDNARRYTRERANALALQHSLLPHRAPRQAAVEAASRYLPAHSRAGVGGDWFDVIPLSGARVALVVGDVVGHGLQASATMGRLRTAVRTLADVDLAPDELLTQLDDLVLRLDREEQAAGGAPSGPGEGAGEFGATCLYAVYDPVARRCGVARAGHPPPALATPDGRVEFLDIPVGPPLGLGGLPFEVTEFDVPEGSVLALYTDGLVEAPDRDPNAGYELMRAALADPGAALEDTCDRVLRAVLPGRRADDMALLLARTRGLDEEHVATWELPSDPAIVSRARALAGARLADWGLEEAAFVTEMVVSELVTNALRYGSPPIRLRLIRDETLICEVSDAGSAAPHLRRARVYDEGGRGLLIVAQLTERWGSRHTGAGKTIWAEQALPRE